MGGPRRLRPGDVTIGEQSNIWYNAVLRGDQEKITVGKATTIQDCCVLHGDAGCDVVVGDYVTVGHGAVLHAARWRTTASSA